MKRQISVSVKRYKQLSEFDKLKKISALIIQSQGKYKLIPIDCEIVGVLLGNSREDLVFVPITKK